jgi:hypothetical protein
MHVGPILLITLCVISFLIAVSALALSIVALPTTTIKKANGFAASTGPGLTIGFDPSIVGLLMGTGSGVGAATAQDVTSAVLTGLDSTPGVLSETDTLLSAVGKLDGNIAAIPPTITSALLTGFVSGAGTIATSEPFDSIQSAIQKLDGNTPSVQTGNGFAGSAGPAITLSLSPSITGLIKGTGTGIAQANNSTDVTDAKLTGYVSGPGVIDAKDSLLSSIQKLNGNDVQPPLTVSSVAPVSSVATLVLNPDVDLIFIDTSNFSAICTLGVPSVAHILTVQLKNQRGLAANIQMFSGGSFIIDATIPLVQLFYNNGWIIVTTSTTLNSFVPNQQNVTVLTPTSPTNVGAIGGANFGSGLCFSADGTTLAIGGTTDNTNVGAVFVFVLVSGVWTFQQKLIGSGVVAPCQQNIKAMSADGNTMVIASFRNNSFQGVVWVFVRSAGVWTEQQKIIAGSAIGNARQGSCASISADGNTLLFGGPGDDSSKGAAWVFTRTAGVWTEFQKIAYTSNLTGDSGGVACAMSADASILAVVSNAGTRETTTYSNSTGVYVANTSTILPPILSGLNSSPTNFLQMSANGRTIVIGDGSLSQNNDDITIWTFANNVWTQQSDLLFGSDEILDSLTGTEIALSADGNIFAEAGETDNNSVGATWLFTRSETNWTQYGPKIINSSSIPARQGSALALSSDAHALAIGGPSNSSVWVWF